MKLVGVIRNSVMFKSLDKIFSLDERFMDIAIEVYRNGPETY